MVKLKNRAELAKYFNNLGFKVGAEIGVLRGEYAMVLCEAIPGLKYYGIDNYSHPKGMRNHVHFHKDKMVRENLKPYDATLIIKTSMQALADFEDSSLDFVYIDANHSFDYVVNDIIEWTKKVKKGGIVAGHDYRDLPREIGVKPAVDGYVRQHQLKLNVTTDTQEDPSWWFVKKWNT